MLLRVIVRRTGSLAAESLEGRSSMTPTSAETTLELAYPAARKVEQTDDYFGTTVSDPYRWMEDVDSAELKTWIDAENELTQSYLAQIPVPKAMQRRVM